MFENNVPPSPNLNLNDSVDKSKRDINAFAEVTMPLSSFIMTSVSQDLYLVLYIASATLYQLSYQVYYVRKAIQMELDIWCKHQNVLVYK